MIEELQGNTEGIKARADIGRGRWNADSDGLGIHKSDRDKGDERDEKNKKCENQKYISFF